MLEVFFSEVVIDPKLALAHEGAGEFPGESVEREVVLAHGKAVGVRFHKVNAGFRAGGFQPHGVVPPISTEFQHGRRRRQLREHFLKNEFLKRFVDAAIDGQNQAEVAVVGKGTRSRDPEAVVEKDMLPLDKSCSGIPADGEIQRVGNDFAEAPHEVFVLCFISHVLGFSAEGAEKFSFLKCISRCPRLQPVFGHTFLVSARDTFV